MTRFTSSALDLSTLSSSAPFDVLSFEGIRAARMADLKARLTAAGWIYDVESLESDPGGYLQEASAYRELLLRQAIQDAQKSVLLAFAQGQFLDRLGDDQACARMASEQDERYRTRIQLAPEAFSATGTAGGYMYYAVGAHLSVADCGVAVLNRGLPSVMVSLTVMSDGTDLNGVPDGGNGVPSQALLNLVYQAVYAKDVKLLTDTISVNAAIQFPYTVKAVLNILPGPDPALVLSTAQASLNAVAAKYHRLVLGVPKDALSAALYVPGVDSVTFLSPTSDVVTGIYGFGSMISANLIVNILDTPTPSTEVGAF